MLPVYEGVVFLAVLVCVGYDNLYIFAAEVDDRIERVFGHVGPEQVEQTVARDEPFAVENYRQAGVEVGVVFQQGYDEFLVVVEVAEYGVVGGELHECAVRLVGGRFLGLVHQFAAHEFCAAHHPFAAALDDE